MRNFHINPSLQDKALELVKNEIKKRQPTTPSNTCTTASTTGTNALDSQLTTSKGLLSSCFDKPRSDSKSTLTPYDELNEYMMINVQLNEEDDILKFWLNQKSTFPILFTVVQDFYAIPASNTTVERLFSCSKNTITDKRTSLGAEKVNKLLFLQKNLALLKSFDEQIDGVDTNEKTRKIDEQSTSTISSRNQGQSNPTRTTKKFKMGNEDDIVLYSDDNEESKVTDEIDFF
jgi:hypothetical protein